MDINEVTLLGSIKEISDILKPEKGQDCCWLNIFTDISYKKKDGTMGHNQVNHRVLAYGTYAYVIKEKASIDQKIYIQGRLKVNSWTHSNTFYEKGFIILEKFKLQKSIQSKSKEPENYDQREDMVEDGNEEEDLVFNNEWDSYEDNIIDNLVDENSLEFLQEIGMN